MPRIARVAPGGYIYHVFNRSAARVKLFRSDRDYAAFEQVIVEAHARFPLRILSYSVLPTDWQFLVWPRKDGDLTTFFRWVAQAHAVRWRVARHSVGDGSLYQGRFKAFMIQDPSHFLTVARHVEAAAVSESLVKRAEQWPWSGFRARAAGSDELKAALAEWPVARPKNWQKLLNTPLDASTAEHLEASLTRGRPFGDERWVARTVARFGLEHTVRREGRPSKQPDKAAARKRS